MGLRLQPEAVSALARLDPELRAAAEAIGRSVATQLGRLKPGTTAAPQGAVLTSVAMAPEGEPDLVSLAAIAAAHHAYVRGRGDAEAVSTGALALARLLVWGQRAAMLGPAPRITWIGPEPRRPEGTDGVALTAECVIEIPGGTRRRARAVALLAHPDEPAA